MAETRSSLTAPADLGPSTQENIGEITKRHPSLTDGETAVAFEQLVEKEALDMFAKLERRYADPQIPGQTYCLHSFIPSQGATPDKDGIYGMMKIRGTFSTIREADERSEELIRNHDSYHKIFMGWVGKPLPLTSESTFSADISEIDIKEQVSKVVREDVKAQRDKERAEVSEIRKRERNLREEVEKEANDPYEKYTCLRVKKAQVIWGYMEHLQKLGEMKEVFASTLKEIQEMDDANTDYSKQYLQRYMDARERAGIPEDKNDSSFMKYLNHDVADLDAYVAEQAELNARAKEKGEESNYKTTRNAGNTITVTRVEHDLPEGEVDRTKVPPTITEE